MLGVSAPTVAPTVAPTIAPTLHPDFAPIVAPTVAQLSHNCRTIVAQLSHNCRTIVALCGALWGALWVALWVLLWVSGSVGVPVGTPGKGWGGLGRLVRALQRRYPGLQCRNELQGLLRIRNAVALEGVLHPHQRLRIRVSSSA
jgi:hypothetical protein